MGADRHQWQFPKNEVGKVIGWSDEASPSNPNASKGLVNVEVATPADLAGKQNASANLTTLAGIVPGAKGQEVLATADTAALTTALAGAVDDSALAAPSKARNRNLDQVFITDYMGASDQTALRAGTATDIAGAITDAETALAAGGTLYFPKGNYNIESAVTKAPGTWWIGPGSNAASGGTLSDGVGAKIATSVSATAITMTGVGSGTNYRGGIKGIGFRGSRASFPNQVLLAATSIVDHHFEDIFFGDYLDGIVGLDCKAFYFRRLYGFGTTQDNIRLEGTTKEDNTDHWLSECQLSGDRYGAYFNKALTVNVHNCRPQVSGTANIRFEAGQDCKFVGAFADSSAEHVSADGAFAIQLVNMNGMLVDGVNMYSNGSGAPGVIQVTTSAGLNSTGLQFRNLKFNEASSATGIVLGTPTGGGILNRVSILGCDFAGVTTAFSGTQNVSSNLHIANNAYADAGSAPYEVVATPATDQSPKAHTEIFRMTGTLNTSFNVDIPAAGNYVGKRIKIVRAGAGSGTVTVRGPNGATVGTIASGAAGSLECVCSTSSTTAGSVVYVPI